MPFSSVTGDMFHFKFQNQLGQKIEDSETWPLQAAKWPLGSKKALVSTISQEIASYWPPVLPVCSYRFSAFWLRSKCSICSYQLNIWYKDHVSFFDIKLIFVRGLGFWSLLWPCRELALHCSTARIGSLPTNIWLEINNSNNIYIYIYIYVYTVLGQSCMAWCVKPKNLYENRICNQWRAYGPELLFIKSADHWPGL